MFVVKLFIIGVLLYLLYRYYQAKKGPETICLFVKPDEESDEEDPLINIEPLFKNRFLGDLRTKDHPYEWRDINIHGGFGERTIDLSNTVLPVDEAVISIRHFAGKIMIYVPYEVEVSVHHSSLFGRVHLFNKHHIKLMNHSVSYQTKEYVHQKPRVKIITSIFSGDLEVKRI